MSEEKENIENIKWMIKNKELDLNDVIESFKSIEKKASLLFGFVFLFYGSIVLDMVASKIFYYNPIIVFLFVISSINSMLFLVLTVWPKVITGVVIFDREEIFDKNKDIIKILEEYHDNINDSAKDNELILKQKSLSYKNLFKIKVNFMLI